MQPLREMVPSGRWIWIGAGWTLKFRMDSRGVKCQREGHGFHSVGQHKASKGVWAKETLSPLSWEELIRQKHVEWRGQHCACVWGTCSAHLLVSATVPDLNPAGHWSAGWAVWAWDGSRSSKEWQDKTQRTPGFQCEFERSWGWRNYFMQKSCSGDMINQGEL